MRKSEQICARITPEEMTTLRELADKHCMLLSDFIRQTLAEKVRVLTKGEVSNGGARAPGTPGAPFRFFYR